MHGGCGSFEITDGHRLDNEFLQKINILSYTRQPKITPLMNNPGQPIKDWPLTSLREKLIKIGAKLSDTAAMSPSRWPKWPSRDISSPPPCG